MPLYPMNESEAQNLLDNCQAIAVVWCPRCRRLVIPLDRFQEFCPEEGDLGPIPRESPRAWFTRSR